MILFATNPLFTAIGSFVFFKERLTKNLYFAYLLAFTSLYLLLSNTIEFNPENLKGELSGVVSAFFYSAYILSSKKTRQGLDNGTFASGIYLVCGLCFLTLAFIKGTQLVNYPQQAWLGILGTILIPTFLGHAIFTYLMNFLNINWMSCGKLLEPVMSALVAYMVFQEQINATTKISFLLTIMAVTILLYPKLRRKKS